MKRVSMFNLNEGDVFEKCLNDFYHNTDAPILVLDFDHISDTTLYVTAEDEEGLIYADFSLRLNQEDEDAVILIEAEGDEDKYIYVVETGKTYTI